MAFTPPINYNSAVMVDTNNEIVAPAEFTGTSNFESVDFTNDLTSDIRGNVNLGNGVLQKGWYYNYIDKTNLGTWQDVIDGNSSCDFYITQTQVLEPVGTMPSIDTSVDSGWEVGDIISFVDNNHGINVATISAINHNCITIELNTSPNAMEMWGVLNTYGWRPLVSSQATNNDYSLYVLEKPDVGYSTIVGNTINVGNNNVSSNTSIIAGNGNTATPDNTLTCGRGLISSALYGSVVGKFNVDVGRSGGVFVVGVGASDVDRKNGLVVNTNGTVLNGKMTSDTAEITGAVSVGSLSSRGLVSGLNGGFADSLSTTSLTATTGHFDLSVEINGTDVMSEINSKQDTLTAGTNISISPTSEISATSGSITSGATTLVTGGTVYNYIPRIASTSNVTVTPMAIQTATTIVSDTVSGYITVIPTSTNVGAVYIIDGSTYSNANPIYPDPAFVTRYQYANLSTVKLFVDTLGDSAVCVVEKNNI